MPNYFKSFKGIVYRSHNPKWSFTPVSGEGARLTGGRFNPVGTPALYTSLTQTGALIEAQQGLAKKMQPQLICSYDVSTQDIIDLSDKKTLNYFGINSLKLDCAWKMDEEPYSHRVYESLLDSGASGIICPSFAKGAAGSSNLILWKWGDELPYKIIVIDDMNKLPRNQLSWQE